MSRTQPREVAVQIVRTLRDAGRVAYLAGGCVRDELLGLTPKDYDVATDAPPELVSKLFRRTREVGKAFGVMLVSIGGVTVEVSTFRREQGYSDKRRPDSVEFCDAESDAHRRDFTINALFIDPLDTSARPGGRVIDHVGGLSDLQSKIIRAVGDPERRLAEDHLRALRAARFASRLGFAIEPATQDAIVRHARELQGVSRERVGDELRLMCLHPTRADAFALIEELTLDGPALGEPERGAGGSLSASRSLPRSGVHVGAALAAWAIDRMGPVSAAQAAAASEQWASRWRRSLCLSNDETTEMRLTIEGVGVIEGRWDSLGVARRKRAAAAGWFAAAMAIVAGRNSERARAVEADVARLAAEPGGLAPTPLVNGDDLIHAGLTPGPAFGRWLDAAYDAQLEGRITSRDAALGLVMGWAKSDSNG